MINTKTLVINLFGGPGTGKSTTAALTFGLLKQKGHNAEYVPEYAKAMVWEGRPGVFKDQLYIFGKQHYNIFRTLGQVDVCVTDAPLLLSLLYGKDKSEAFKTVVLNEHFATTSLNIFLVRKKAYNPAGRFQSEEQARGLDDEIRNILDYRIIPYSVIDADDLAPMKIYERALIMMDMLKHINKAA